MNRPWMPLYVADYLADTGRLSTTEHGAYLLLIMEYWQRGGVPDDDVQLARIVRLSPAAWKKTKPAIASLFQDGWRHKRIDAELAKAAEISSKRRASAQQKHSKSSAIAPANAEQLDTHARASSLSLSPSEPKGSGASAPPSDPKTELFRRGREVLGKESGALIAKLLRSFGPEDDLRTIAKARARIEEASTKAKPVEWLGRVMAPKPGEFKLMSGIEGVV